MLKPQEIEELIINAKTKSDHAQIKKLIEAGEIPVDARLSHNATPMHVAATYNRLAICYYLFCNGAKLEAKDEYGSTPLFDAALNGWANICDYLAGVGADIHTKNNDGLTPDDLAKLYGHADVYAVLLKHGKMQAKAKAISIN